MLEAFGLLVILCNHGKHRSLSLAYELSERFECELISIRSPDSPNRYLDPFHTLEVLTPVLSGHVCAFGGAPHPVLDIRTCWAEFDGPAWASEDPVAGESPYPYHHVYPGDVLVDRAYSGGDAGGWSFGYVVLRRGDRHSLGWYPPEFTVRMERYHFASVKNLYAGLVVQHLPPYVPPAPRRRR